MPHVHARALAQIRHGQPRHARGDEALHAVAQPLQVHGRERVLGLALAGQEEEVPVRLALVAGEDVVLAYVILGLGEHGIDLRAQGLVGVGPEAPLDTRQGAEVHQHQPHRAVLAEVVDQSRLDLAERGDEHAFIVVSRRGLSKRAARFRPPTAPGPSRRP